MKNVAIRVVKSSQLPMKIATYLVKYQPATLLGISLQMVFFKYLISLGWSLTFNWQLSHLLQNFLTILDHYATERLGCWTCNLEAPSSSPAVAACWICSQYSPDFKSSTMLVNGRLVCLWPVGILNPSFSGICSDPLRRVNNGIFFSLLQLSLSSPFPLSCWFWDLLDLEKRLFWAFSSDVAVMFIRPLSEKKSKNIWNLSCKLWVTNL